jgi:hypothetical protein
LSRVAYKLCTRAERFAHQEPIMPSCDRNRVISFVVRSAVAFVSLTPPLVLLTSRPAGADVAPPAKEQSQFETHWGASLARDCGFSRQLPSNQSIWIFCDTAIYDWTGKLTGFISGSTAASGTFSPDQVPTQLVELPTPPAAAAGRSAISGPAQFLPNPTDLTRADGSPCTASSAGYPAAWPSGAAQEPNGSSKLLITYLEVCVDNGALLVEGFGLLEYDSANNTIVTGPTEVFRASGAAARLPPQLQLGSPIFNGNVLYLFSSTCDQSALGGCTSGRIFVSNVLAAPSYWQQGGNYWFWFSTVYPGWTHDYTAAQSVISGATPTAVTVDNYPGKGLALIEQTSIGGSFRVWTAPAGTFVGSWSLGPTASSLAGCQGGNGLNLCRALTGHPEISTGAHLLMSYYDPSANHVKVVAVPW